MHRLDEVTSVLESLVMYFMDTYCVLRICRYAVQGLPDTDSSVHTVLGTWKIAARYNSRRFWDRPVRTRQTGSRASHHIPWLINKYM